MEDILGRSSVRGTDTTFPESKRERKERHGKKLQQVQKRLCVLLTLAMLLAMFPVGANAAGSASFADIQDHWGREDIVKVVDAGLFKGVSETAFDPNGGMSQAMFVTVLSRLHGKLNGSKTTEETVSFTDVPAGTWYADAVTWAVKAGITTGYGDNLFGPENLVMQEYVYLSQ